jgi:D-apiose dehydrogenase
MKPLRFAIIGTGFWSRYQIAAWRELRGVECVALFSRTRAEAEALSREFGIARFYDDPRELLERESLDFVDTHARFTRLAAASPPHTCNGTSKCRAGSTHDCCAS